MTNKINATTKAKSRSVKLMMISIALLAVMCVPRYAFAGDSPINIGGGGGYAPGDSPITVGGGGGYASGDPITVGGGGGYASSDPITVGGGGGVAAAMALLSLLI